MLPCLVSLRRCDAAETNLRKGPCTDDEKWRYFTFVFKLSTAQQYEACWLHVMLCRCFLWRWQHEHECNERKICCGLFRELWFRRFIFPQENNSNKKPNPHRNGLKQILMSWSGYVIPLSNQEFVAGLKNVLCRVPMKHNRARAVLQSAISKKKRPL